VSQKKKLLQYDGLYGEQGIDTFSYDVFTESIFTRSKLFHWKIEPHFHANLFQLFIIERGSGTFITSDGSVTIAGPMLISIPPDTVHGFMWDPRVKGHIITLNDTFFEQTFHASPNVLLELSRLHVLSRKKDGVDFTAILRILTEIQRELCDELPERQRMLFHLFGQLYTTIYRSSKALAHVGNSERTIDIQLFAGFQKKIRLSGFGEKTIPDYAKELGLSTTRLNLICHRAAGRSALRVIQDHCVRNAKNLLVHTSNSVSEIAYELRFDDPAYFSRFFKKHTGSTPQAYREHNRHAL